MARKTMHRRVVAVLGLMLALVSCAVGNKAVRAEWAFQRGQGQEHAGQIEAALRSYQEAVRLRPEYTEPHRRRAILLAARGEGAQLHQEYRAWLDRRPESPVFHYLYGRLLEDTVSQLVEFDRAIALDPNYYWGHYGRAYLLANEGKIEQAIRAFEAARDIRPNRPRPYMFLGYLYTLEGKLDAAIGSYHDAVRLNPRLAVGYQRLASLYVQLGEFLLAIEAYRNAAQLDPQDAQSRVYLGNLLKATEDLDGAVEALQSAVEIQPGFADAWRNLGVIHHERGELESASAAYERAAEFAPDSSVVAYLLGVVRLRQGKYDVAIAAFQRVIRIEPEQGRAYYFLGEIARRRGDPHQAVAAYERATEFLAPHPEVYYRLGRAYVAVGKYPEAASAFERSVHLLEEVPEGAAGRAPPRGEGGLALDIPPPPDLARAYSWWGQVLVRIGNLSAAEMAYQKAVTHRPKMPEPHRALGEIYERRGETQRAITVYQSYLQLAPDGAVAEQVRRRLEVLQGAQ